MKNFLKIKNGDNIVLVDICDISAISLYQTIVNQENVTKLDIYLKGNCGSISMQGVYDEIKNIYAGIEETLSVFCNVFELGEKPVGTELNPPKVARNLPDLDKCVLITED